MKFMMLAAGCVVALSGCTQEAETAGGAPEGEEAGDSQPQSLTPVDTAPAAETPTLAAVSRAEIETELEAGAGCSVEQDGKALLIAVNGDAIARPYGTMRHFSFDGDEGLNALQAGGRFTAGVISIRVEPAEGEGEQIEGVTVRQASVTVSEEGQTGSFEFAGTWECGA